MQSLNLKQPNSIYFWATRKIQLFHENDTRNAYAYVKGRWENSKYPITSTSRARVYKKRKTLHNLPVRMGGLGISHFSEKSKHDYYDSINVLKPLTNSIIPQSEKLPSLTDKLELRAKMQKSKNDRLNNLLHDVENTLILQQNRAVQQIIQKSASSWLNVLPLEDYGFTLTKGEFCDALALHYTNSM